MNKKDKHENDDNRIDKIAKQIFSYDEESLLKDFESAEQEANTSMGGNQTEGWQEAEPALAALMARIHERSLQPIYQEDYDKRQEEKKSGRKVVRLKAMWKPMAVAAVMIVITMATAIISQGKRGYWFWERQISEKRTILNNMEEVLIDDPLYDVYKNIEGSLDMRVITPQYLPKGIKYIRDSLNKNTSIIEFEYEGKLVYLMQVKSNTPLSSSYEKDVNRHGIIYNSLIDEDILLGKKKLENGEIEYYGDLTTKDVQYRFCGKMDEEIFIEILQNFNYLR